MKIGETRGGGGGCRRGKKSSGGGERLGSSSSVASSPEKNGKIWHIKGVRNNWKEILPLLRGGKLEGGLKSLRIGVKRNCWWCLPEKKLVPGSISREGRGCP